MLSGIEEQCYRITVITVIIVGTRTASQRQGEARTVTAKLLYPKLLMRIDFQTPYSITIDQYPDSDCALKNDVSESTIQCYRRPIPHLGLHLGKRCY